MSNTENETQNKDNIDVNTVDTPSPKGWKSKLKSAGKLGFNVSKNIAKNKTKTALMSGDGVLGTISRTGFKLADRFKKTKKYVKWIWKYIQFCISNPIGWICGIITLYILANMTYVVGTSLYDSASELNQSNESEFTKIYDNGVESTILLMDCKPSGASNVAGSTSSSNASDSDWLKEGTRAYNNAKDIFTAWTNAGLSGTAASGLLGWIESEGGFDIIGRAEGHYGGTIEENSIMYGNVPIPSLSHYSEGGGGSYQITPYTKYRPLSHPDWENGTAMTNYVIQQLPNDWIPDPNDLTGGNHTFEQFAQESNPEDAALMWNSYERGHRETIMKVLDKKKANARRANEVFNKDNIPFDKTKFEKTFGSSRTSVSNNSSDVKTSTARCKMNSSSGGSGWSKNGGTHSYSNGMKFKYNQVPSDLKQYAIDPKSIGINFGDSSSWLNPSSGGR